VASPLIHERDLYLAWSLKRSKAVNGTENVVGVIGAGHMQGVVYHLIATNSNLRFKDLVGRKGNGQSSGVALRNLVVELAIGTALWFAWTEYQH
jgi:pheromone shutdown protein TraB